MKPLAVLLLLLVSLPAPAFADNPAMGPYGSWVVWGPELGSLYVTRPDYRMRDLIFSSSSNLSMLPSWHEAMQAAGICIFHFLGDGSGIRLGTQTQNGCEIGPVISFPEFRRRMEAP